MLCALVGVTLSVFLDSRIVEIRPERFIDVAPDGTQYTVTTRMTIRIVETCPFINDKGSGPMARVFRLLKEEYYIRNDLFCGQVVALTEDTLTVKNWSDFPRTFAVSPTLTSKRIPLEWRLGTGHRLGDVRVGDKVTMDLAKARDGPVCIRLGIYRRPGGIIPPAEDEQLPAKTRLHIRCNAEQFVEETLAPKWVPWMLINLRR